MAVTGSAPRALLDRYELREQVGSGGMGEVWMGWDRRLQRDVAVKLLLPQLSDEPTFRTRFGVEARAAAALDHPNVVAVYDIDEDAGSLFIVMERLPGPSLDRKLMDGPVPEDEVLRIASDMLLGLGAAHASNLIHRDIKPGNLIRSAGGRWKVCDFGVAKDLASAAQLTLVGVAVGTPAYLAPEQLEGRPAAPATDLWAAAVVLREALTGHRPFEGADPIAVAHAVRHTQLVPLTQARPDINPHLAAAVDRSLSLDPAQRFASAADMAAAIEGNPPVEVLVASTPATGPGPTPGVVPAHPEPAAGAQGADRRRSRLVAVLWAVTAIGATILAALLIALFIGAVIVEEGEDDSPPPATAEQPQPDAPAEAPTSLPPSTSPSSRSSGSDSEVPEQPDETSPPDDDQSDGHGRSGVGGFVDEGAPGAANGSSPRGGEPPG